MVADTLISNKCFLTKVYFVSLHQQGFIWEICLQKLMSSSFIWTVIFNEDFWLVFLYCVTIHYLSYFHK